MTILNLNNKAQYNTIAVTFALEKSRIAIAHLAAKLAPALATLIQKTRKSPEDVLAAQQRRAEAHLRVDRLRGMIR